MEEAVRSYFYALPPPGLLLTAASLAALALFLLSLRPKRFYIVRHGSTLMNEAHLKQGADGGLSEKGVSQAHALGTALKEVRPRIEMICTSPYERAKETASIIATYLKVPVRTTPLLAERRNPSEIVGKPVGDPDVERITGLIEKGFHDDVYRFSDEENFLDLSLRAKRCLRYLERRPQTAVAVVTHHAILHMLMSYLLYRDTLDAAGYAKLAFFNPVDNAGITICEYHPLKRWFTSTRGWEILGYNERAEAPTVRA